MNIIRVIIATGFSLSLLFSATEAMASHDQACKPYAETCKADADVKAAAKGHAKKQAWHKCIAAAAAADTANGAACTEAMNSHHKHGDGAATKE